jgi:hypothetical protein
MAAKAQAEVPEEEEEEEEESKKQILEDSC